MHVDASLAAWEVRPVVETTTATTESAVVSLDDIKGHVSQPLDDDDGLLQAYELAAREVVGALLGRPVLTCTRRAWFDSIPGPVLRLSEPANAVSEVRAYEYDGSDDGVVVATTVYRADCVAVPARVVLRDGQTWPTGLRRHAGAVSVTYTTGWAAAEVPASVVQAVKLLVAHWYETRQPDETHLPDVVSALLMPYRLRTGVA